MNRASARVAVATYLTREDHLALIEAAAIQDASLASVVREVVRRWLTDQHQAEALSFGRLRRA